MKLNNRLFWKKSRFLTNCFSCFNAKKLVLVFFVGLFALSGLFAEDAKIVATEDGVTTNWSSESTSWVDSNGNPVQQAPNNSEDTVVLNTVKGSINLTVTENLSISTLIIYGENPCTININNGINFNVDTLVLGSGGRSASTDLILESDNNILGQIQVERNGILDIAYMDTTSICGQNSGTLKNPKLTIKENASVNITGTWNLGEYGSAVELENNGNLFVTENRTGRSDLVIALSTTLGENYVWKGTAQNGTWDDTSNWTAPANSTIGYPSKTGDIAVFNLESNISLDFSSKQIWGEKVSVSVEGNGTINLPGGVTGNICIDGDIEATINAQSSENIIVKNSANILIKSTTIDDLSIDKESTVRLQGQTIKGSVLNEGSLSIEKELTVTGDIINNGTIDIAATTLYVKKNYSGTGTIKSAGGKLDATLAQGDENYPAVQIHKINTTSGEGKEFSISLLSGESREIQILENEENNFGGNIEVDYAVLPKGKYENITIKNQGKTRIKI